MANANDAFDKNLQEYSLYITRAVRRKARNLLYRVNTPEETEDIIQDVILRLLNAEHRTPIEHFKAYTDTVIRSVILDRARKHTPNASLSVEIENYEGQFSFVSGGEIQDPLEEVEQAEMLTLLAAKKADDICNLSQQQQRAMVCFLREQRDEAAPLLEALKQRGIDFEQISCPVEQDEIQRLRSSLYVARKKLRPPQKKAS